MAIQQTTYWQLSDEWAQTDDADIDKARLYASHNCVNVHIG